MQNELKMPGYSLKDIEKWERREHYNYYTQRLKVQFSLTSSVDAAKLLESCHARNIKFYPALIYCVTKVVNQMDNFRMFRNAQGDLCVWDKVVPNYTIFHKDDKTFSDCWTDFSYDFETFYKDIVSDMKKYENVKGIKAKAGQPANFYCVSCVPWITFSGYSTQTVASETPPLFPIITIGKYEQENGKMKMPVNLTIAHAVCDGYHASQFFQKLQEEMDKIMQ